MVVIDCDAHVEESEETWSYLDPDLYKLRPIPVTFPEDTCFGTHNAAWVIDYKLRFFAANPTTMKRAREKSTPIPVQELLDVPGRLACMDEIGVDIQVVFPSIWLGVLAENVELEAELARSYNTFMATQCGQSNGRVAYVAVLPFRRPDLAVQEIRRVREMGKGVVGIFARGVEWDLPLSHPSFWPIYEEAERQGLPICVHTGNGSSPTISRMLEGVPRPFLDDLPHIHPLGAGLVSNPYVIYAFQQLLSSSVMQDFPKLRVAFLEAGTEWAPRIVKRLRKRTPEVDQWLAERVFLSCELEEDLPYVASKLGDECLVTATDFPHGDAFRQDLLADGLRKRGDLEEQTIEKILSDNPRRLWSL